MEAAPSGIRAPPPPSPSAVYTSPLHTLAHRVVARRRSPSCNLRGCHTPRLPRGWSPASSRSIATAHSPHNTALVIEESLQDHEFAKDEAQLVSRGAIKEGVCDVRTIGGLQLSAADGRLGSEDAVTTWVPEDRFLQCCEPGTKLRVAVLLSGGVDSSVALRLLCAAGHSCTAFYLKIWFQDNFENFWSSCPWEEDLKYAQEVCDQVFCYLDCYYCLAI
ncbi:hypothetical protein O6H91_Y435800 [Diphasiastrum complanatum]|nr:hypothetical protein O6H91_Y435800 [Diphasiastrum complanatum]